MKKIIDNLFHYYILNLVKTEFVYIKKYKYSDEYFLSIFIHVLKNFNSWKNIQTITNNKKRFHYKYCREVYNKWVDKDIFKRAYCNLLTEC